MVPTIENEDDTSNLGSSGKITLIEAVERFKSADSWRKRTPKTQASYSESFQLLFRFLTETRYIHTIRPGDMEAFREILGSLPVNCSKTGDLSEAIKQNGEKLAPATMNRHITAVRQLFDHLRGKWYIKFDPSLSLSRFERKQKWVKVPFTEADLKAMFLGDESMAATGEASIFGCRCLRCIQGHGGMNCASLRRAISFSTRGYGACGSPQIPKPMALIR